jgi:L-threonylcarbamoyladenylate synthase
VSVAAALLRGEIVLLETDTLVGLHGIATEPEVINKLIELKGSSPGRGFLLLFFGPGSVFEVAEGVSATARAQLEVLWPGPLTAVFRAQSHVPAHWCSEQGTLAARVPALPRLRALLAEVGAPLFSTSANRAGQPPLRTLAEARQEFPMLTSSMAEDQPHDLPSTVVDFTVDPPRLLREGALAWPPGEESDFVPFS